MRVGECLGILHDLVDDGRFSCQQQVDGLLRGWRWLGALPVASVVPTGAIVIIESVQAVITFGASVSSISE